MDVPIDPPVDYQALYDSQLRRLERLTDERVTLSIYKEDQLAAERERMQMFYFKSIAKHPYTNPTSASEESQFHTNRRMAYITDLWELRINEKREEIVKLQEQIRGTMEILGKEGGGSPFYPEYVETNLTPEQVEKEERHQAYLQAFEHWRLYGFAQSYKDWQLYGNPIEPPPVEFQVRTDD